MPYPAGHVGKGDVSTNTVKHETKRGSDFTGTNAEQNRTVTLEKAPVGSSLIMVWIDNVILHYTQQYTVSGSTVTIIDPLDDNSYIDLFYFTVV